VGGDRFVSDCAHHHPVLRNHKSPDRLQMGRFCGDFGRYRPALSVSGDACGLFRPILASRLCIRKFRSPRRASAASTVRQTWEHWEFREAKSAPFRARPGIIADLIRGLRTAGTILPGHHEGARLQCRAASDLRPRRARGLVRGTRARSSC
jgi:hypothetical protein